MTAFACTTPMHVTRGQVIQRQPRGKGTFIVNDLNFTRKHKVYA